MVTSFRLLLSMVSVLSNRAIKMQHQTVHAGSTLYNSDESIKVLQCGLPPEPGMKYQWTHNYNETLPEDVQVFGTTLLFGTLSLSNTGLFDCCGEVDGKTKGCVRNRVVMFSHENEIRVEEPDADGNVPLAMGYRYNVVPFTEEVLLRDCQFTLAFDSLDVPTNTYVAGPMVGIDVVDLNNYGTYSCVGRRRHELVTRTINIVPAMVDRKSVA
ncbi:hypothetical protein AAVH_42256 [Aphelenchoides avenae]|nr:hypothetical protein AAVH_42256 [Aphelenchus avenae]